MKDKGAIKIEWTPMGWRSIAEDRDFFCKRLNRIHKDVQRIASDWLATYLKENNPDGVNQVMAGGVVLASELAALMVSSLTAGIVRSGQATLHDAKKSDLIDTTCINMAHSFEMMLRMYVEELLREDSGSARDGEAAKDRP